jgi:probable phosphoglycerate mutase
VTGVTAWYIRHGHNPANQARQLSHKVIDYPLTDLGVAQATALAAQLAARPGPAAIYASPLRRAAQTAEIIAARTGSDVAIIEGLRELDVGDLDGRMTKRHGPSTARSSPTGRPEDMTAPSPAARTTTR